MLRSASPPATRIGLERAEGISASAFAASFFFADDERGQRLVRLLFLRASACRGSAERRQLVLFADGQRGEGRMLAALRSRLLLADRFGGRTFFSQPQRGRSAFFAEALGGRIFLAETLRRAGTLFAETEGGEDRSAAAGLLAFDEGGDRRFLAHGQRRENRF